MAGSFDLTIITDRLPFGIDDAKAVNALYVQFIDDPSPEREQLVEAWTYGYICKYMVAKHAKGSIRHVSDIEMLIGKTYERVRKGRPTIKEPDKYAHWVSVVTKNTFINYVNRYRVETDSIEDEETPTLESIGATTEIDEDVGLRRQVLEHALDRLPPYLRKVARLYYFKDLSFKEVGERLDKSAATVRVYKSRVLKALREDPDLKHVFLEQGG